MADEARAMLDALMGGDRDAPLPQGAATADSGDGDIRAPRRTRRSCFDRDICPLYCAWGVDVYELFRNTKSDTLVGINPNIVDDAAREEFKALPKQEQERLGYHRMLFLKLQELVHKCDRTVNRNKEKLRQENAKQLQKRGGQDFVVDVDDGNVAQLASAMVRFEFMEKDLTKLSVKLQEAQVTENEIQTKLDALKQKQETKDTSDENKEETKEEPDSNKDDASKSQDALDVPKDQEETKTDNADEKQASETAKELQELQQSWEKARIEKQRILMNLKIKTSQYSPLEESIQNQRRHLEFVKSDITSDKTVCEVSGNFMSARDADERIAAHYAGKQYVGWKLVRDKLKQLIQEYGRYGPPPPSGGPPRGMDDYHYGGRGGGGRRSSHHDRDRSRDRSRGGRRSPSPQYWERGGGSRGYGRGGGDWRRDRGGGRRDGRYSRY